MIVQEIRDILGENIQFFNGAPRLAKHLYEVLEENDLLENNNAGILVQNGDIKGLAEKIILLIENETMRKEMGKAAYDESEKYLPEPVIRKWIVLLENLITKA